MNTTPILTSEAVDQLLFKCLFTEEEISSAGEGRPPEGAVIVEGILQKFGFHPDRITENREAIRLLLSELPLPFRHNGGGWSFLQGCMDRNDRQWGEHRNVEALLVLGLASGLATYLLPREVWGSRRVKWYMSFSLADVGLPVIETGESGMKGCRGVLVPSVSSPGTLSVLWLTEMNAESVGMGTGRMQTSLTYGTTPDVDTRAGFLWLVDFCEDLGLKEIVEDAPETSPRECWSITEIRASYWWTSRRQTITKAIVRAIASAQT